jgi:hypothetical protein
MIDCIRVRVRSGLINQQSLHAERITIDKWVIIIGLGKLSPRYFLYILKAINLVPRKKDIR